jgi:hypothetical protein|tara:strand:+ start:67382 stop:67510 length:129 start_codon:yes stop_codon:yes gene_type:complete
MNQKRAQVALFFISTAPFFLIIFNYIDASESLKAVLVLALGF